MLPVEINNKKEVVCFGEVLWDIFPSGAVPGGAPMNVAYHLHKQRKNVALITKIGIDEEGKKLVDYFSQKGICTDYFQVDYEYETGKVYAKPTPDNDVRYDIVMPAAWDHISWEDDFAPLISNSSFFVFGSLVTRHQTSAATLFRLLETAPCKVLDINLRAGYFTKQIINDLLVRADIVKLNSSELEFITGWFSFSSMVERMQCLSETFKIPTVIVTAGPDGAMLLTEGRFEKTEGLKINVQDTVGSGDAFLAGYLSKLMDNAGAREALIYANKLAAFIATQLGGCPDYERDQLETMQQLSRY
jgi:fructokinase